jgi:hypothetical protein
MTNSAPLKKFHRPRLGGWLLLLFCLLPGWVQAAEFSATVVTRANGRETQDKLYVKGDKMSREFVRGQEAQIVIFHKDRNLILMLMPARKVYLELPSTDNLMDELAQFANERAAKVLLGTEEVNGYLSDKYETSVKDNGGSLKHIMWVARKLGQPIKAVSPDGSFSMEYRNIKEGGVPDSVFEVPPGFQKMGGGAP